MSRTQDDLIAKIVTAIRTAEARLLEIPAEREKLRREEADLARFLDASRAFHRSLTGDAETPVATPEPARPGATSDGPSSVRERVVLLVNETDGGLSTPQLVERFRDRWKVEVPVATLNSALSRAAKANEIERLSHGHYGPVRSTVPSGDGGES